MTGSTSWVEIALPMMASASLTLGLIQGAAWLRDRTATAQLAFAAAAISMAMLTLMQFFVLKAVAPDLTVSIVRWMQVLQTVLVLCLIYFVHVSLRPGHAYIALAAGGLRIAALVLDLLAAVDPDRLDIERQRHAHWWDSGILPYPTGSASGWPLVAQLSNSLVVTYVLLGFYRMLRNGDATRRRTAAVVFGGCAIFAVLMMALNLVDTPLAGSPSLAFVLLAICYQLGSDALHDSRLRAEHGRAGSLPGVSYEVTRRLDAEERFRWLVDTAPTPTVLIDTRGRICRLNAAAGALFGYRCADLVGHPLEELVPDRFRGGRAAFRGTFNLAPAARPSGQKRDLHGLRADGSEIPIEVELNPIQFDGTTFVLVAVTDLTERRRMDREADLQREQVTHLSRVSMLGELSGSLAHELNQPLSAILSNAQACQRMLRKGPAEPGQLQGILADIVENDRRAGDIIRHLRSMLRKEQVESVPLDMNGIVDDALRLIRSDVLNRDISVETDLSPDIGQVSGDRVQLQQVLLNLLVNAFDAMDDMRGPKIVKVGTRPSARGIIVTVEDRGVGIQSSMLDHVFTPFETSKENGLGLGLTVCRTIVQAHGGRIWAENATPTGTRFCFEMPVLASPS